MTEDSTHRFSSGRKGVSVWILLIAVSVLLLIENGQEISVIVWALSICAICAPLLLYRTVSFRARENELLTKGMSLAPYSYSRQMKAIMAIVCVGFAGLLSPLVLSGTIPADIWFGSLIGILDGWLLYLVLFFAEIWMWERKHGGILYRLELWNGPRVTHVGLKFQRVDKTLYGRDHH